jgi:thioredoxin-dependent peroxiredoxin
MAFPKKDPNLQPLPVGTPAPNFSLPASGVPEGQLVSLKDYAGKPFVLVFYPKDKTPGCTQQLCDLTTDFSQFQVLDCAVIASNSGSLKSHESFTEKYGYCFPILVDAEKTMAAAYSVLKAEGGYQRTVYVVDGAGIIRFAQQGMAKHADLLACLQSL